MFAAAVGSPIKWCRLAIIFKNPLNHQRFDLVCLVCADLTSFCRARASLSQPTNEAFQLCLVLHFPKDDQISCLVLLRNSDCHFLIKDEEGWSCDKTLKLMD